MRGGRNVGIDGYGTEAEVLVQHIETADLEVFRPDRLACMDSAKADMHPLVDQPIRWQATWPLLQSSK